MESAYTEDQEFSGQDYSRQPLPRGEYENCVFRNCNFAEANLKEYKFIDTEFIDCNLSNARLLNTAWQDVVFQRCKLLGLRFDQCSSFGFSCRFNHCQLNHASFYKLNLITSSFSHCQLEAVDFTQANLKGVSLSGCHLQLATFSRTRLEDADFREANGYQLDPEDNWLKGARFSLPEVVGLLSKYRLRVEPAG